MVDVPYGKFFPKAPALDPRCKFFASFLDQLTFQKGLFCATHTQARAPSGGVVPARPHVARRERVLAVSYTHLTLPTTPYV